MSDNYKTVKLRYKIHKYSSYSADYVPENIMTDMPTDQLSRWFTDTDTPKQFIMLKLDTPSIVETVTFGKYMKAHVSDLKKFQILGGTDEDNLSVILSAGLKNDHSPETFTLRYRTNEGLYFPILYIKIIPLQSWGPAYNYTIWYIELHGRNNDELVQSALETITLRKEEEAVRILLKHLRRRRYRDAFEALSRESGVRLEGSTQASLWNALVEGADYDLAETIMNRAIAAGELDWYMSWLPYTPRWQLVSACSSQVEERLFSEHSDAPPPPAPALLPAAVPDVSCSDREWIKTARLFTAAVCLFVVRLVEHLLPHALQLLVSACAFCVSACWILDLTVSLIAVWPRIVKNLGAANVVEICEDCESLICSNQGSCSCKPGPRGGHQLVVDSTTSMLYLYGGWNGTEDLDDLWAFNITTSRWILLCRHSYVVGGPSARSCHKMVLDPKDKKLYTLGRYLDNTQRTVDNMKSDLYAWDLARGTWYLVCEDTAAVGGPRLVFDHQMCIDPDTHTIYVFGGRVLPTNNDEVLRPQYSGLYAYYCRTDTWQLLLSDQHDETAPQPRVGHSMLFHPTERRLYIFAGQRNKEHLLDLWWWDVGTGRCGALATAKQTAPCPPPSAGFTQRATLDPDTNEMFVLSGMSKEKDKRVYNALWVYSLRRRTWHCVYRSESECAGEPRPRFAHQLVYDPTTKVHYLFGGNPGSPNSPRLRLDDLWALTLARPPVWTIARKAQASLREAHYKELAAIAAQDPRQGLAAVEFLRTRVHEVLDHTDPKQVQRFQKLATLLFADAEEASVSAPRTLTPELATALSWRRFHAASAGPDTEISRSLAAVLGADDNIPETQPFEEPLYEDAEPPTWDRHVPTGTEGHERDHEWESRAARLRLYDELCRYFRPSTVPPTVDVAQLVAL